MAQPHEFGRGRMLRLPSHRSGIRARYCQACLTHTAITPPAGQSARSKAALRGDTAPDGVSHLLTLEPPRRQGAPVHSSTVHHPGYNRQRCTTYVAAHPLRRAAPEQKGCNAYGSGAPPPTTSLHVVFLAGATHAGVQQAQAAQHCTRYDSNALDRKALH